MDLTSRTCNSCKDSKNIEEFCKDRTKPLGFSYICKKCKPKVSALWRNKHKEQDVKHKKKWIQNNPEKIKISNKGTYPKRRNEKRFKNTGCTPELYAELLERADNLCQICRKEEKRSLSVDHCHISKKIRGVLCTTCNLGLGQFKDNPELLEKAAKYLRETT